MLTPIGPFREGLFEGPSDAFGKHLTKPENDRILFSGKFGIGKSFFLDHYFKGETQITKLKAVQYRSFHIFPVNYSIASNEDIFRYIKYDVITSMLLNGIELEEKEFEIIDSLPGYVKDNFKKVLSTLIFMAPKIGKPLEESYKKFKEIKNDFEKYSKKITRSEEDTLDEYLTDVEREYGSLFENDAVTQLIKSILLRSKTKTHQENVLIIDDLDRIDPAHLFRILNVFAAHLDDSHNLGNKLGFDKIIVVCDIKNVKSIFRSIYGINTDFNGYIDKFYRYDIFHFDNRKELFNILHEAFRSVDFNDDLRNISFHENNYFRSSSLPIELLELFLSYGFINLRSLLGKIQTKIPLIPSKYLTFDETSNVRQFDVLFLVHFEIAKELVGGYDVIKEYAEKIPARGFLLSRLNNYCNQLLYFVHFEKTFRAKDFVSLTFNGKFFKLKVPDKLGQGLDKLVLFDGSLGSNDNPVQVNYTSGEFKTLLGDFLDLMIRIENK